MEENQIEVEFSSDGDIDKYNFTQINKQFELVKERLKSTIEEKKQIEMEFVALKKNYMKLKEEQPESQDIKQTLISTNQLLTNENLANAKQKEDLFNSKQRWMQDNKEIQVENHKLQDQVTGKDQRLQELEQKTINLSEIVKEETNLRNQTEELLKKANSQIEGLNAKIERDYQEQCVATRRQCDQLKAIGKVLKTRNEQLQNMKDEVNVWKRKHDVIRDENFKLKREQDSEEMAMGEKHKRVYVQYAQNLADRVEQLETENKILKEKRLDPEQLVRIGDKKVRSLVEQVSLVNQRNQDMQKEMQAMQKRISEATTIFEQSAQRSTIEKDTQIEQLNKKVVQLMDELKRTQPIESSFRSQGSDLKTLRTARDNLLHDLTKSSAQAQPMPMLNFKKVESNSNIQIISTNVPQGDESQKLKYLTTKVGHYERTLQDLEAERTQLQVKTTMAETKEQHAQAHQLQLLKKCKQLKKELDEAKQKLQEQAK